MVEFSKKELRVIRESVWAELDSMQCECHSTQELIDADPKIFEMPIADARALQAVLKKLGRN